MVSRSCRIKRENNNNIMMARSCNQLAYVQTVTARPYIYVFFLRPVNGILLVPSEATRGQQDITDCVLHCCFDQRVVTLFSVSSCTPLTRSVRLWGHT